MNLTSEQIGIIENLLATGEFCSLDQLLEDGLEIDPFSPEAGECRHAIRSFLTANSRYQELRPSFWGLRDQLPQPPRNLRLPTVREEGDAAVLLEALEEWQGIKEEEGLSHFTHRLSYRDIHHGAIRLHQRKRQYFPSGKETCSIKISWEGEESTAWYQDSILYGLDKYLYQYEPGAFLRFNRISSHHFAVSESEHFDEAYNRSESRQYDLAELKRLRRFDGSYHDQLALLLSKHTQGLALSQIMESLETQSGFRPDEGTIRALLSSSNSFRRVEDSPRRSTWFFVPDVIEKWKHDYQKLQAWFAEVGQGLLARESYRALIMTIGGSAEPLRHTISQTRPEWICFVASESSETQIPTAIAGFSHLEGVEIKHFIVKDHEDFKAAMIKTQEALQYLIRQGVRPHQILVDFTGGTKAMSAGAVVATVQSGCAYSYVGGGTRSKDNLGVVITGHEVMKLVAPVLIP